MCHESQQVLNICSCEHYQHGFLLKMIIKKYIWGCVIIVLSMLIRVRLGLITFEAVKTTIETSQSLEDSRAVQC